MERMCGFLGLGGCAEMEEKLKKNERSCREES